MKEVAINIDKVHKHYGSVNALQDISLKVEKGELFGLIGPDGAGKTSLFRILTSLLIPDSGQASIEGFDVVMDFREIRKIVGYMPGRFSLYYDLSVEENLKFYATIFGTTVEDNYDLIKDIYIQIEPFKKRRAGKLSGGMKQKLLVSFALGRRPKILLMDEPAANLDPKARTILFDYLHKFDKNALMIISSHRIDEVEDLVNRLIEMDMGKIVVNKEV